MKNFLKDGDRLMQESQILLPCGFKLQHMFLHKAGVMLLWPVFCGYTAQLVAGVLLPKTGFYRLTLGAGCFAAERIWDRSHTSIMALYDIIKHLKCHNFGGAMAQWWSVNHLKYLRVTSALKTNKINKKTLIKAYSKKTQSYSLSARTLTSIAPTEQITSFQKMQMCLNI